MAGIMPHELRPGFVNVYRNTYSGAHRVAGFVYETREQADSALLSRKCVYRIRIVEVHDLTLRQRELRAKRVARLNAPNWS